MLDAFFNLKYPKDNTWFDGLKISGCEKCQKFKNAYPVIYFDFEGLDVSSMESFWEDLRSKMSDLYRQFEYLLDSEMLSEYCKRDIMKIIQNETGPHELRKSITRLSRFLHEHHGKRAIILVDEYDRPIHDSRGKEYHQDIVEMIRSMLYPALKGNESLEFGVIMGMSQIYKESIFSGFNNLDVDNIFSSRFDRMFGFTDDDVRSILEECGHPEKYEETKEWYYGYRFGDADVYNPWSVLNYICEGFRPQMYWAKDEDNSIVDELLHHGDDNVFDDLDTLSQGKTVLKDVETSVIPEDVGRHAYYTLSMMAMMGYLRADSEKWEQRISIPNREMSQTFGELFERYASKEIGDPDSLSRIRQLSDAFLKI